MSNFQSSRLLYWDSCVFVDYFAATPNRIAVISDILSQCKSEPDSMIYTSVFSVAENSHLAMEKLREQMNLDTTACMDALWHDRSVITVIEVNGIIARLARDLARQAIPKKWVLKPADSIQLASAYWLKHHAGVAIDEIHTYDDKLYKYVENIKIKICEPYVQQPSLPGM